MTRSEKIGWAKSGPLRTVGAWEVLMALFLTGTISVMTAIMIDLNLAFVFRLLAIVQLLAGIGFLLRSYYVRLDTAPARIEGWDRIEPWMYLGAAAILSALYAAVAMRWET